MSGLKLGYAICYVDDVQAVLERFEAAFGLTRRMLHPDGGYAELDTGATVLSLAEREFGRSHFEDEATRASFDGPPARFELGFVTDDVAGAWERALSAGMVALVPPVEKPWGQTVAWVRDPEGLLIELASPM